VLLVRLPAVEHETTEEKAPSLWQDTVAGWRYIVQRRGLLYLAVNGAAVSFSVGMAQIVITPLILDFAGPTTLGAIFSVGGLAMLTGGLVMAAWGGPRPQVRSLLWFGLSQSVSLLVIAARPNVYTVGLGVFGLLASIQFVLGSSAAIIRAQVPHDMQARVFALSRFVAWSTLPFAYFAAGPLASGVFEPLLRPDGALAGSVGRVIGTGPGRGIAFQLIVLAVVFAVAVLVMYANPGLRHVEQEPTADATAAAQEELTVKEAT
jgi:DHA3 family macrolide efflux protein-like MFS transporter